MSVHDGEDSSSGSPMSSKSRKSRSRSYDRDLSSRSRSRERTKNGKRSFVVFVRNLHESVSDDDLLKHFEECGEVLDASVIKDRKHNRRKGFGFVCFASESGLKRAIQEKNGTIFFSKSLVVQVSTRKTTVYVGNLPWDFSSDKDASELQRAVEERCKKRIVNIRLKGRYAFCEFVNFEHTQAALQKLPGLIFRGREVRVQLANTPRAEEDVLSNEKTLFIRNISNGVTEKELRNSFEKFGELTRCEIIRDRAGEKRDYGFVAFKQRDQTHQAYRDMHRATLGGKEICVEYAKTKEPSRDRRTKRHDRSRSRESHRSHRRREGDSRRPVQRNSRPSPAAEKTQDRSRKRSRRDTTTLEIDDVLARGWPVLAYDTTVGRMVLLSSDSKRLRNHGRDRRRGYD